MWGPYGRRPGWFLIRKRSCILSVVAAVDPGSIATSLDQLIDTYGQTSMLWWVSGTALVGAMIAGVWLKRDEIVTESRSRVRGIFLVGGVFLATLIVYGGLVVALGFSLNHRAQACMDEYGGCGPEVAFTRYMPWAIVVGTTSFGLALVGWIVVYRSFLARAVAHETSTGE